MVAPAPLKTKEGSAPGPGWRGEMKAQPPARPRGRLGRGHGPRSVCRYFLQFFPPPQHARRHTHTHRDRSSSGWVFFPALARGAGRALFAAVEDAAVRCPRRCVQGEVLGLFGVLLGLFRRQRGTRWCGRAAGRSRGACCPWAALLWGKWLLTLQLWCLHGGFSLTGYPGLAGMAGHVLGLGT